MKQSLSIVEAADDSGILGWFHHSVCTDAKERQLKEEGSHFAPLDGLRGIAILAVVSYHAFNSPQVTTVQRAVWSVFGAGWVGVILFFALSGFLITGILIDTRRQGGSYLSFYARRTLRIFPIYFAFLVLYFFLLPRLIAKLPLPSRGERAYYWFYLENMIDWFTGHHVICLPLGQFWSLCVEEQLYLLWPLMIMLLPSKYLPRVVVGLAFFSIAWRCIAFALGMPPLWIYIWTPGEIEPFAYGGLLAWVSREKWGQAFLAKWTQPLVLASGLFIFAFWLIQHHWSVWTNPKYGLTVVISLSSIFASALISLTLVSSAKSSLNRSLSQPILRYFGRFSYAMYVFHRLFIFLLDPYRLRLLARFERYSMAIELGFVMAILLVSFCAAAVSWYAFERHFLKLKQFFPSKGRVILLSPTAEGLPATPPLLVQPHPTGELSTDRST